VTYIILLPTSLHNGTHQGWYNARFVLSKRLLKEARKVLWPTLFCYLPLYTMVPIGDGTMLGLYCQRGFLRKQEQFCDLQKQPSEILHYSAMHLSCSPWRAETETQLMLNTNRKALLTVTVHVRNYMEFQIYICKTAVSLLLSPMTTVPHIAIAYLFKILN